MIHKPTDEQAAILDFALSSKSNLMIRAFAGCGKTSTLEMLDKADPTTPKLLLCFNKAIAAEAVERMQKTTSVKTFNGIGHKIWADTCGRKLNLQPKKISEIFRAIVDEAPKAERKDLWASYDLAFSGVNLARAIGYVPESSPKAHLGIATYAKLASLLEETPSPEVHAMIDKILNISISQAYTGLVDFSDQVYMSGLFSTVYPAFPIVMIDEYQDLSPVNQAMVAKLCKRARQIGVGDEAQAIYGFRGADETSMPTAINRFDMSVLPLSITFRCPSKIVENVRWRVPDFKAHHDGGIVEAPGHINIVDNSAVICRNNGPLIALAMKLTMLGKHVDVSGVDISAKIIRTMTKLGSESLTKTQALSAIDDWLAERESLDSKTAADLAQCMKVFVARTSNLAQAIGHAKHLFETSGGTIKFMTGHKAKGLEFDHVYHLDRDLLKHKDQDDNIHYVIDSRPKQILSYIHSTNKVI